MDNVINFVKQYWKLAAYVVGGSLLVYLAIWIFTFKPQMPAEYKQAIDSLNKANAALVAKQKSIDSTVASYQSQIFELDYAISNIKTQKTEVHNHYHVLSGKAEKYTPSQVDSFFRSRYSY